MLQFIFKYLEKETSLAFLGKVLALQHERLNGTPGYVPPRTHYLSSLNRGFNACQRASYPLHTLISNVVTLLSFRIWALSPEST